MRSIVDTDWVIHYLNGHLEIVARIQEFSENGIGLSLVSLAGSTEAYSIRATRNRVSKGFRLFFRGVELIGIDDAITRIFGRERGRLRALSKTIGDFDLLIGATALRHDIAVLTNNRRHFELIENLQIISV